MSESELVTSNVKIKKNSIISNYKVPWEDSNLHLPIDKEGVYLEGRICADPPGLPTYPPLAPGYLVREAIPARVEADLSGPLQASRVGRISYDVGVERMPEISVERETLQEQRKAWCSFLIKKMNYYQ